MELSTKVLFAWLACSILLALVIEAQQRDKTAESKVDKTAATIENKTTAETTAAKNTTTTTVKNEDDSAKTKTEVKSTETKNETKTEETKEGTGTVTKTEDGTKDRTRTSNITRTTDSDNKTKADAGDRTGTKPQRNETSSKNETGGKTAGDRTKPDGDTKENGTDSKTGGDREKPSRNETDTSGSKTGGDREKPSKNETDTSGTKGGGDRDKPGRNETTSNKTSEEDKGKGDKDGDEKDGKEEKKEGGKPEEKIKIPKMGKSNISKAAAKAKAKQDLEKAKKALGKNGSSKAVKARMKAAANKAKRDAKKSAASACTKESTAAPLAKLMDSLRDNPCLLKKPCEVIFDIAALMDRKKRLPRSSQYGIKYMKCLLEDATVLKTAALKKKGGDNLMYTFAEGPKGLVLKKTDFVKADVFKFAAKILTDAMAKWQCNLLGKCYNDKNSKKLTAADMKKLPASCAAQMSLEYAGAEAATAALLNGGGGEEGDEKEEPPKSLTIAAADNLFKTNLTSEVAKKVVRGVLAKELSCSKVQELNAEDVCKNNTFKTIKKEQVDCFLGKCEALLGKLAPDNMEAYGILKCRCKKQDVVDAVTKAKAAGEAALYKAVGSLCNVEDCMTTDKLMEVAKVSSDTLKAAKFAPLVGDNALSFRCIVKYLNLSEIAEAYTPDQFASLCQTQGLSSWTPARVEAEVRTAWLTVCREAAPQIPLCDMGDMVMSATSAHIKAVSAEDCNGCCSPLSSLIFDDALRKDLKGVCFSGAKFDNVTALDIERCGSLVTELTADELKLIPKSELASSAKILATDLKSLKQKAKAGVTEAAVAASLKGKGDKLFQALGDAMATADAAKNRKKRQACTGIAPPDCNAIETLKDNIAGLAVTKLSCLTKETFLCALAVLGNVPNYAKPTLDALATLAKTHIGADLSAWTSMQVTQAGVILSANVFTAALKTLKLASDEAIISLGNHNVWTTAKATDILTKRLADKSLTADKIVSSELKRLSHIICGMTAAQIAKVTAKTFKGATRAVGNLPCLTDAQLKAWKAKAVKAFGAADTWKRGDLAGLGIIIAGLDATEMGKLSPVQLSSIGPNVIPKFAVDVFKALSIDQIKGLTSNQAQAVTAAQMAALAPAQKTAVEEVMGVKKPIPPSTNPTNTKTTPKPKTGVTTKSGGGAATTPAGGTKKPDTGKGGTNVTGQTSKPGVTTPTTPGKGGNATDKTGKTVTGKPTGKPTNTTGSTASPGGKKTTTPAATGNGTTAKPKGPKPPPTKPSAEELMKKVEEAKKKADEMMKDPSKVKPEQAKQIASTVGQISSKKLEKMPKEVKTAVLKDLVKKQPKGPAGKSNAVKILKLAQSVAKGVDAKAMSKDEATKYLEEEKDMVKLFPASKQLALLDKVDVTADNIKKLAGPKMDEDYRIKLTQKLAATLKPAAATPEQIQALPAEIKASLPASFASEMSTDVAKKNFVPIVEGSVEVSKTNSEDAPKRPTTTVYALLGKQLTPADNLDAAAWKAILKHGLLGAMNFSDVQNAPADNLCPKEAGIHKDCGEMCTMIYHKCRPVYGAVTTANMDFYGDAIYQMAEADFTAITDEALLFTLAESWSKYKRKERKSEYMNSAIITGLFKMLKSTFAKDNAKLKDAKNLKYYGKLLMHPSFVDIFKNLPTDILQGVCQGQMLMPLMLSGSTITEMRSKCLKAEIAYSQLGTLLLNLPAKEAEGIKDADLYQSLGAIGMGTHDAATRKAVADRMLKYALKTTSTTIETMPKIILLLFNTLLGQFNSDELAKINKETLEEVSIMLASGFKMQEAICRYRSKEGGFPASTYCSKGLADEMKNILTALSTPATAAAGRRRRRNAPASQPVTCISMIGLGDGIRYLTPEQLKTISQQDFNDCASRLGNPALQFNLSQLEALAGLALQYWGGTGKWTADQVRMAGGLAAGLQALNLDTVTIDNLETAMRIGTGQGWARLSSTEKGKRLSAAFKRFAAGVLSNDVKKITGSHLRMISNLACGASAEKINTEVPKESIAAAVIELGLLTTCTDVQLSAYAQKAIEAFGKTPEPRDMQILVGGLTGKQIEKVTPSQMKELTPTTIENLPAAILIKFTKKQLQAFTPAMASRMTAEQRKALPEEKREVIMKILKDNLPAEAVGDSSESSAMKASYNPWIVVTLSVILVITSWKGSMI